jgi:Flp pilus assembly protein TadD
MHTPTQNQPCPCGSGKKYKRCCGHTSKSVTSNRPAPDKTHIQRVQAAMQAYQQTNYAETLSLIEGVLKTHPDDPGLLGIQGMALYKLGRTDEADKLLVRATRISPDDPRLHNFLGQICAAQGEFIRAERAFGRAVTLDPDFAEAWYNLGNIQLQGHQPDEAEGSLLRLLAIMPRDAEVYLLLARARILQAHYVQAGESLAAATRYGLSDKWVLPWQSVVLRAQAMYGEADALEANWLKHYGQDADFYSLAVEVGSNETLMGHLENAERWLMRAIAQQPESAQAYRELASTRKFRESDRELIGRMETILQTLPIDQQQLLEFALGKVLTDLKEYDASFQHYRAGNSLMRARVPFDTEECIAETTSLIESLSAERIAQLPAGSLSNLPILIVGTPRSGTTLTEQIISSHSLVGGAGEMSYWSRIGPLLMAEFTEEKSRFAAQGYLELMQQNAPDAQRITDKMPGNFQCVGQIHAVFPNVKFIHTKRHPIDACLSIYFQNFNDGHPYKADLESLALWYEQYQRLMAHWRAVLPPGVMYELQYEALVEDVEGESRKLMDFLGLDWEPGQLDFHKQDRAVFTCSRWQARQPIYKTSKDRWRNYEQHLGPLLRLLKYAET